MRGIKERQVAKLMEGRADETVDRMLRIVDYFDSLIAANSKLISKSPVGFLYRAMENPDLFVLPEDRNGRRQQGLFGQGGGEGRVARSTRQDRQKAEKEGQYLIFRRKHIEELMRSMSADLLQSIRSEVERALSKLKGSISEDNFKKAVDHGVEERVARLFAVPDFDEWAKAKQGTVH
jgi:hypothetical protein